MLSDAAPLGLGSVKIFAGSINLPDLSFFIYKTVISQLK